MQEMAFQTFENISSINMSYVSHIAHKTQVYKLKNMQVFEKRFNQNQ